MDILVTGAAGFIGSHLTERLLASGHSVVGLDSFDTFYDPATKERNLEEARSCDGFQEMRGDIRDPDALHRVPGGVEAVIHLAARAGVRPSIADPMLYMDVNLNGTMRLLEFMRERAIPTLLFGSSSSVYGDSTPVPFCEDDAADRPISPYAATKRAGELLVHSHCQLYGVGALCLRFFTVYGPRQRPDLAIHKFARMLSAGEEIPMFGDGSSERDYTEVEDILDGIEGALEYARRARGMYDIVNLGGGRTVTLLEMIEEIGDAMRIRPRVCRLPDQPGDVRRTFADLSKAERLLGYRPSVPFDEGIRRFAAWFADREASRLVASL